MRTAAVPLLFGVAAVCCTPASPPATQSRTGGSLRTGQRVAVSGVVTAARRDGRGFWLQRGTASTPRGVYVRAGKSDVRPVPGDHVEIDARVTERRRQGERPQPELDDVTDLRLLASGRPLPEPVLIEDLPDVDFAEAIAFWTPLLGARVALRDAVVVGPTDRFGDFVAIAAGDARPGSGYHAGRGLLFVRPLGGGRVDYNPERIVVTSASLAAPPRVSPGDRIGELVGVASYAFGGFRIEATRFEAGAPSRTTQGSRAHPREGVAVASLNLENLFDLEDDPTRSDERSTPEPGELETKLAKLALAVETELALPEIVAVQEVENVRVLTRLAERINGAAGTDYRATALGSSDGRGIEVGFLHDAARVELEHAFLLSGEAVAAAFGPSSPSPGREPLAARFRIGRHSLTAVACHLKSKSGDDPLFGARQPPLRPTERQRADQARALRSFVEAELAADPGAMLLVIGDMNDFGFGEPGEGPDHTLAILRGSPDGLQLVDLTARLPRDSAYSFLYRGNAQLLDHALASPALASRVRSVEVLHFNATAPEPLARDPATARRASDHDPLRLLLELP